MEDTFMHKKIQRFYSKHLPVFRAALEVIINKMLKHCTYTNGESLERHNWGNELIKLKDIPSDINSSSFEENLLKALDLDENQKAIIELLWGDVQLGKRVHALIMMWFSVYIFETPVLYVFRCLNIDKQQLQDDISAREGEYDFQIQFIKNLFNDFNSQLQENFNDPETKDDYWKEFALPELKDTKNKGVVDKIGNKDYLNSNDIFCCLMHYDQLEKINEQFNKYIYKYKELVSIRMFVDEGDLISPTASLDRTNKNDLKNSTACERLIAKMFKKVKYALHITGTAHSLLYNTTTALSDDVSIQTKISQVHKMIRSEEYYGLFNDKIVFNRSIKSWWEDDGKKYDIIEDYNINIKGIIGKIVKRTTYKYNSLLITEEVKRDGQFSLVYKILQDFPDTFIIIFHGGCLRLYLSKDYEQEIKICTQRDASQYSSERLWQTGGIYGSSIDTEKSMELPNKYCYFEIDSKKFNIKMVYKVLAILFIESNIAIKNKTVVTITGKYGMRGYSFTSDNYEKYSMHLTDQYHAAHAKSFSCTLFSQIIRMQLKSNDTAIKNGNMKLTLWTTNYAEDVIKNFFVPFIKELEKHIMACKNNKEIKDLVESIILKGERKKTQKYMNCIDVKKKRQNLKIHKHYEEKNNGYRLITLDDMDDADISEWCKQEELYGYDDSTCVNSLKPITDDEYKKLSNECIKKWWADLTLELYDLPVIEQPGTHIYRINDSTQESYKKRLMRNIENMKIKSYNSLAKQNICVETDTIVLIIDDINKKKYKAVFTKDNFVFKNMVTTSDVCKLPKDYILYKDADGNQWKSSLKEQFKEEGLPNKYYWKTPDGWLFYNDGTRNEIFTLTVKTPKQSNSNMSSVNVIVPLINSGVKLFVEACFKPPTRPNLRFCLKDIYKIYEEWCKNTGNNQLKTRKRFKEELEKLNYLEGPSQGVDINGNPGKRGYNVMVSL